MILLSRRTLLVAGASLPLLRSLPSGAASSKVLRFALSSFPPSLQPWTHTGTAALTVKLLIFRGLTGFGPDGEVRPELAESWQSDADNGWTFKLREARFHNGAPVTAEDVKWSLEQIAADEFERLPEERVPRRRQDRDARSAHRAHRHEAADRHPADLAREPSRPDRRQGLDRERRARDRRRALRDEGAGARRLGRGRRLRPLLQAGSAQGRRRQARRLRRREPAHGRPPGRRHGHDRVRALAGDGGDREGSAPQARRRRRALHVPDVQRRDGAVQGRAPAPGRRLTRSGGRRSSTPPSSAAAGRWRASRSPPRAPTSTRRAPRPGPTIRTGRRS